ELAKVQSTIDSQAVVVAKKIAEIEKQRDVALSEAVYAKAKLAAHGGSQSGTPQPDAESRDIGSLDADRSNEIGHKLANALFVQSELRNKLETVITELQAEQRARKLAEDTAEAAQEGVSELEAFKQRR